jgi:molecular chaperone DnaK
VALVRSDKSTDEMFTVIDGDMERIGGRDWDTELIKFISEQVEKKTGISIINHEYYHKQLKTKAVEVKKKLSDGISTSASARIAMQNGRIISVPVTLNTFEEITYGLMMRALDCLKRVYFSNVSKHNIEEIVCVGGSSNMRQVRYNIQREFPDITVRLYEPEHAVVNGAAIYADLIRMRPEPVIRDIASFSYGILAYEDYHKDKNKKAIFNLVRKGTPLPAKEVHTFCSPEDNLASVALVIFESENSDSKYDENLSCTNVGNVSFPLPPNSTSNFNIHCEISLLGDGFLYFNARDDDGNNIPARFKLSE